MPLFSPIPESVASQESILSADEMENVPDIDDIFSRLREATGTASKPASKASFEEIQKVASKLPRLSSGELVSAQKQRRIAKVDDPIEVALPKEQKAAKSVSERWFELPKVELTDKLKRDLVILKNRASIDPKRFYKKDKWEIPERFQVGTLLSGPTDFHNRIHRKSRGTGFVDELLKDEQISGWLKKRFEEVQVKKGGRKVRKPKKRSRL
ncbi:hypothetical protein KL930_004233 [Ogataea haglerorum]|nr:hypothetical protein KL932_003891 [Ogataea haglerorum]KAG7773720.1 hypothetical protein KL930_004233 [Ogataea haglerorum]KAG7776470.1 hypothetical protein KL922_003546 [Ogataea haglerorum]